MRIAYVCYGDARQRNGVVAKIASQVAAWRAAGCDATIYLLTSAGDGRMLEGEVFAFDGAFERVRSTRQLFGAVADQRFDLVYLRYDLFLPPPWRLARWAPTVVEVNSNAHAELAARNRLAAFYEQAQRPPLFRRAAGIVYVSNELAGLVPPPPETPTRVIPNGVDLASVPVLPPSTDSGVRVVYMGDDVHWRGTDKITELARAFPDWQFDLVGVSRAPAAGNVTAHGFLPPDAYEPILAQADFALGTLALHRIGLDEASPLKVVRYLAYGLPTVIAYDDSNLVGVDDWYILRLPNSETNVRDNTGRIAAFARAVKGRRIARTEIADRISTAGKEAERLAFFEAVVSDSRRVS